MWLTSENIYNLFYNSHNFFSVKLDEDNIVELDEIENFVVDNFFKSIF
jgi:hypothetical protein